MRPAKDSSPLVRALASANIDLKAFKMALYGFLVSAPLSHYLVSQLQKAFAGKTSPASKVGQILANNLIVAPIQTTGECVNSPPLSSAVWLNPVRTELIAARFAPQPSCRRWLLSTVQLP